VRGKAGREKYTTARDGASTQRPTPTQIVGVTSLAAGGFVASPPLAAAHNAVAGERGAGGCARSRKG
jgi:hypothetical protein